jgi:NADPH:quinone reductase-like Zn-dependent oxidoreductase
MRAVVATEPGGPEVLVVASCPTRSPARRGAGRRRRDGGQPRRPPAAQGFYPPPPGASDIIGLECSGTVAALGEGVDRLAGRRRGLRAARRRRLRHPGRRAGGPADAGALRASTWSTAAALPEVACTVWSNVFMVAGLQPGETVPRARRRRRHRHLRDPARRAARGAGLHDRRLPGEARAVRSSSAPTCDQLPRRGLRRGAQGGDRTGAARTSSSTTWARSTSAATSTRWPPRAGWSIIGMQGGTKGELDIRSCCASAAVIATSLRARGRPRRRRDLRVGRRARLAAGRRRPVVPIVHTTLPLDEVAEAHRLIESGDHTGKILLTL